MSLTYKQRVQNSMALLDQWAGEFDWLPVNWREKINLDTLDMFGVRSCILAQLYDAHFGSGGYDLAFDAFGAEGVNVSDSVYLFHSGTCEWIEALKASAAKFQAGQVWYNSNNNTRTVLAVNEVKGVLWITFEAAYSSGATGVMLRNEAAFVDGFSLEKPKRFSKGDELISKDGDVFYYISDNKVIRATNKGLQWDGLAYYERNLGTLTKRNSPTTDFYFDGKFFWND